MPAQQTEIPGTERPKIKAIEVAADVYVDIRDKRMKMTEKETAAKAALIKVVQEHADKIPADGEGKRTYRYSDDLAVVLLPGKPNVKVKHVAAEEPEEE